MQPTARKRFGQHFLTDQHVLARIVHCFQPTATQSVVEIGPGRGALTAQLLAHLPRMTAVEVDRTLVAYLRQRYPAERLNVIQADILQVDLRALSTQLGSKLRLIGNLPYNISTPLLFHILEQRDAIEDMVFMFQQEVALRLLAQPGSKRWGRLSVMVQRLLECEHLLTVAPQAFTPPPKVQSSVLKLKVRAPALPCTDPGAFANVVTAAFSTRRKTLRNTLKPLLSPTQLEACNLDPAMRVERVTLEQFICLAQHLSRGVSPGVSLGVSPRVSPVATDSPVAAPTFRPAD